MDNEWLVYSCEGSLATINTSTLTNIGNGYMTLRNGQNWQIDYYEIETHSTVQSALKFIEQENED